MKRTGNHTVYTIGHSTRGLDELIGVLQSFGIKAVVDVRRFPGSRSYPAFNKDCLERELGKAGIGYLHLEALGGRRAARPDSRNSRWRNDSFRGYADYMETGDFERAAAELEAIASKQPTVYLCAEAVWWRCHRSMISDYLKAKGWRVLHILSANQAKEHPFTSPARIHNGRVSYSGGDLPYEANV